MNGKEKSIKFRFSGLFVFKRWPERAKEKALASFTCKSLSLVLEAGLEPAQPRWPRDFKSLVSTIPPFEQPYICNFQSETLFLLCCIFAAICCLFLQRVQPIFATTLQR